MGGTEQDQQHHGAPGRTGRRFGVAYTRHSGEEYLAGNLERLAQRRTARQSGEAGGAVLSRGARRVLAGLATFSLLGGGAAFLWGQDQSQAAAAEAASLRAQLSTAAASVQPSVTASPVTSAPSVSPTQAGPTTAPDALLDEARRQADEVAELQNELAELTRSSGSESLGQGESDELLEAMNRNHARLGELFSTSTRSWSDEQLYGWESLWALASDEGDPRLVWTSDSLKDGAEAGCTWDRYAVSAKRLVEPEASILDGAVSVLWRCAAAGGGASGWAVATWRDGVFSDFEVGRLRDGALR